MNRIYTLAHGGPTLDLELLTWVDAHPSNSHTHSSSVYLTGTYDGVYKDLFRRSYPNPSASDKDIRAWFDLEYALMEERRAMLVKTWSGYRAAQGRPLPTPEPEPQPLQTARTFTFESGAVLALSNILLVSAISVDAVNASACYRIRFSTSDEHVTLSRGPLSEQEWKIALEKAEKERRALISAWTGVVAPKDRYYMDEQGNVVLSSHPNGWRSV